MELATNNLLLEIVYNRPWNPPSSLWVEAALPPPPSLLSQVARNKIDYEEGRQPTIAAQLQTTQTWDQSLRTAPPHRVVAHLVGKPGVLSLSGGSEEALEICGYKGRDETRRQGLRPQRGVSATESAIGNR